MNRKTLWLAGVVLLALLLAGAALAAPQAYDLAWWTVDGGGGISAGGAYSLSGTIGQADAGNLSGGGYTLAGGFWGTGRDWKVYLPVMIR